VGIEHLTDLRLAFDLRDPAKQVLGDRQALAAGPFSDLCVQLLRHVPNLQCLGHESHDSMRNACVRGGDLQPTYLRARRRYKPATSARITAQSGQACTGWPVSASSR
jgi:hypothetical protein